MSETVPACPFCRAPGGELVSLFGSQLLLSQYRCTTCGSYFEGLRPDDAPLHDDPAPTHPDRGGSTDGGRTQ